METIRGKIQISFNNLGADEECTHKINVEQAAKIEIFLNDKVALMIYKKFGALIRVHM